MSDRHRSWEWQKFRNRVVAKAKAAGLPCAACGRAIDYDAPPRTRWAPELDHIDPLSKGGALIPGEAGVRVMHKSCNSSRGDGTRKVERLVTSRDWWS